MTLKDWLTANKDVITALAGIVGIVSFATGAYQLWQARETLQAQAAASALASGRELMAQIEANPETAASVWGAEPEALRKRMFVQRVVSLFSEQHLLHDAGVIDGADWNLFKRDLCEFVGRPDATVVVKNNLEREVYPRGFADVLRGCLKE